MSEEIKEKIKAYYIGSDIDKVLDYIQQKENIIKEVREYIEIASYLQGNKILEEIELLKILDKVGDEK